MSAKPSDLARIQEMFDLITETQGQIERLGITEERFKRAATDADRLFSEAIMNRVLRITEEAGALSDDVLRYFDFERRAIKGVRNRLAHAYGDVGVDVIWDVVQDGFPKLLDGCQAYCDDLGLELERRADEGENAR